MELVGLPNWRLPALQDAIKQGQLAPLADLPAADFYGSNRGINYAQARYFCQYLQHRGLLREFYKQFRVDRGQDLPQMVQFVCGESIEQVDQDMRRWVMTLKWP